MSDTISITVGALEPPLTEQLRGVLPFAKSDALEADSNAITRCNLMGYMPDAAAHRARQRLIKKIEKTVQDHRRELAKGAA